MKSTTYTILELFSHLGLDLGHLTPYISCMEKQIQIVVFDLDGTVIDSSHRHATLADGSLDLAHWLENSTPEKIMGDSLLPLARSMRAMYEAGQHIVVCTARTLGQADMDFLACHNLQFHGLLYREIGDMRPDAELKTQLLEDYCSLLGYDSIAQAKPIMFDDNLKVLDAMKNNGVITINATKENWRLAA